MCECLFRVLNLKVVLFFAVAGMMIYVIRPKIVLSWFPSELSDRVFIQSWVV